MIILDTNVISEQIRPQPDKRVSRWIDSVDPATVTTTTITVAELRYGAARLPQGGRRADLERWIEGVVAKGFRDRVESFDLDATNRYASIRADRLQAGRPIAFQDAQIAAICLSRGATLATRNIKDFEGLGVNLVNPWEY
ncbi:type II toxin-antitoxin system VapC family toxin [Glycomyces albus]